MRAVSAHHIEIFIVERRNDETNIEWNDEVAHRAEKKEDHSESEMTALILGIL
jgi:hypothetical protein